MSGLVPDDYEPDTWTTLTYGMTRREELDYLRLTVMVTAIITAGRIAAGGEAGDSLKNALQSYRSMIFPEIETDLIDKAKRNEKILEEEFKRGPIKIQALDYGTKRRKKR